MNMTPKKILSLPVYGSGTTLGLIAAILLLPGGLIMAVALGCYWLADRMSDEDDSCHCDMSIEEYEEAISADDDDIIPVPFVEFKTHPEVGFKFTLQQCINCAYADACLTPDDGWCDNWEKDEYVD
jgi:hypothetical protein